MVVNRKWLYIARYRCKLRSTLPTIFTMQHSIFHSFAHADSARAPTSFAVRGKARALSQRKRFLMESLSFRNFVGVAGLPLRHGDAGVEQTIDLLRRLIDDAVKDPAINVQAIQILRNANVSNFGTGDRIRAFYDWISQPSNFLYVPDPIGPFGPKETLRPARTLFQVRGGDCDDYTALLASLAGTVGIRTRAVTIAADRTSPNDFSHIYPEAEVRPNMWIPIDAARPGAQYGIAPPYYFRKRVWSLTDSSYQDIKSAISGAPASRASSLNGYVVLGDDNTAAQDISAVGQSVANVISASKGNPWGQFSTPYSPGVAAPGAGYPTPGMPGGASGTTISAAVSPGLLWALVIGGGLLWAASRK